MCPSCPSAFDFPSFLRARRTALGLRQEALGRALGVTANCVSNWEAGRSRPDLSLVPALCRALEATPDELFGFSVSRADEYRVLSYFRSLDAASAAYALRMLSGLSALRKVAPPPRALRSVFSNDACAAAGPATVLEEARGRSVLLVRGEMTDLADEIVPVSGDSMEPLFSDGDRVLVCHGEKPRPGQVGLFVVDGQGYIKQYQPDRLVSLNRAFPDILLHEGSDVRCWGRVLGKVTPDMLPTEEEIHLFRQSEGRDGR